MSGQWDPQTTDKRRVSENNAAVTIFSVLTGVGVEGNELELRMAGDCSGVRSDR